MDLASAELLQHVFDGKTASFERGGEASGKGKRPDYVKIKLKDVIVSSIGAGGSEGDDQLTEEVTLNFSEVRFEYTSRRQDGSKGDDREASWDIARNEKA